MRISQSPPRMPMTKREHEKSGGESALRCMEVEDNLVAAGWNAPAEYLPELIEITEQAFERTELELSELQAKGLSPWMFPITEDEKRFVGDLRQRYPADTSTRLRAATVLDELLKAATLDEVAYAAATALNEISYRARRNDRC